MIIQLDWFGCEPRAKWESLIHQTLEQFATLKTISRAQVRIEQLSQHTPPYQLSVMLSVPRPDVLARSAGHTFDKALPKLTASLPKTPTPPSLKDREPNTHPRRGSCTTHGGGCQATLSRS